MNANDKMTSEHDETYFGVYRNLFRLHVHQLFAWGYSSARHMIKSNNEEEPNITGFIKVAIRNRLVTNDPPWCVHYSISEDVPVEVINRVGRSRPRPDIIIETNMGNRPEYIVEAKRLRKNGYGPHRYIDADGMGCFISGLYASKYAEAAMLGYVQSDSLSHWQNLVKKAINDNAKLLCLRSQKDETVIGVFPLEWSSEHDRHGISQPIRLYHILLDCIV